MTASGGVGDGERAIDPLSQLRALDRADCVLLDARVPLPVLDDSATARGDLASARPRGELVAADLVIRNGRVESIETYAIEAGAARRDRMIDGAAASNLARIDLQGRMVWPACVDIHTHLDNAHTWHRAPNPSGSWSDALLAVERDREANWSIEDLVTRMDFALRCAWVHGTAAIRTHIDSLETQRHMSWSAFAQIRERWRDRIALQGVALVLPHRYIGAGGVELADLVARHGGLLGGIITDDPDPGASVGRIFALARERDLDIDLHVDESGNSASNGLEAVAEAALRHGWEGRVTAGHCCSLAQRDPDAAARTIERAAAAGVAVVSLPMCNLYLQDRRAGYATPRWRGVTLIEELDAAGVPVAFGSDDVRDAYYPYGDLDPIEVYVQALRIAQLERRAEHWVRALTTTPARIMRLEERGALRAGAPADLIVFEARDTWELGARPVAPRVVLRAGRPVRDALPNFRELEAAMETRQ